MASVVRAMGGGSLLSSSKSSRESGEKGHQSTSSLDSINSNLLHPSFSTSNNSIGNDLNRKLSPSRVHGILLHSNRNPSPNSQSPASSPPSSPLNHYHPTSVSSSPTTSTSQDQQFPSRSISTPVGQVLAYNNPDSISKIISDSPSASTITINSQDPTASTSTVPFPSTESRGRSLSRPQLYSNDSTNSTGTTATTTNRSIRFAPLPEIRPRSYSTGRNIWLEDADVTEESGGPRKYIRRESLDQRGHDEENTVADDYDEDDQSQGGSRGRSNKSRGSRSDAEESPSRGSLNLGRFGSWGESTLRASGLSNSSTAGSFEEKENSHSSSAGGSGYSSLLGPLTFGLVKPKKSKNKRDSGASNTSNRSDSNTRRDTSLSRVSSNESDLSRRSNDGISSSYNSGSSMPNRKPTGIPLRKSRTWELGETQQQSRRAMYPPVAQRSKVKAVVTVVPPKFVEWGYSKAGAGGGGLGSVRKTGYVDEPDADDGSGMAWVKRRKEEKKKKAEEEAAAAEKKRLSDLEGGDEKKEVLADGDAIERVAGTPEFTLTGPSATNSGTTTPLARSMSLASRPALHLYTADSIATPSTDSPSDDKSTALPTIIASALPKIFTQAPSPSSSTPSPTTTNSSSDLSSSDDHHDSSLLPSTNYNSTSITSAPSKGIANFNPNRLSVDSFEMPVGVLTDGEDDEEEEIERDDDEEEDSDLDEDELAEEEMLAEKARVTALGAGAERYHSAKHESVLRKVETSSTTKTASPKPL